MLAFLKTGTGHVGRQHGKSYVLPTLTASTVTLVILTHEFKVRGQCSCNIPNLLTMVRKLQPFPGCFAVLCCYT